VSKRNYEYEKQQSGEVQAYHRGMLRYTVETIDSLKDLESRNDIEAQQRFKDNVNGLAKFYYYRFNKQGVDVERPEIIEDEELDGPADLTSADVSECKKVFYKIQKLQDELGHTTVESLKRGNRQI